MCYDRRRAEACVDESAHHALANAVSGTREEHGTLTQGAPVLPGSSRLGIEPMMIILLLFLQKQNLAFAVYLFGSVLSSKRLFRGPSTNDMKK